MYSIMEYRLRITNWESGVYRDFQSGRFFLEVIMAPKTMHAMVLQKPGQRLAYREVPVPMPGPGQVLIKVHACGVCRTDLHVVDGELPDPKLPIIPGHEIVGSIAEAGQGADGFKAGDRIGVPWVGYTDGSCEFCRAGRENLCDHPRFTGYTIDGG
jgi:alcohol dehydrogenase, propanol-preferring